MRRTNLIVFVLFLLVAAGVVASQYLFKWSSGTFLNPQPPTTISVLYSSELEDWLRPATDQFNSQNQKVGNSAVHVDLEVMDDGEALKNIVNGTRAPIAWIPASTIWVQLLNNQWRTSHQSDLILRSGEYGTTPLALTPMVFVMFKERADAFIKKYPDVDWNAIQSAVTTPGGWKDLGGDPDWGRVKYGQTDPKTSNAGLLSVTLAAYTYYNKTTGLTLSDIDKAEFKSWLGGLANGLAADAPPTAKQQMVDMLQFGPSRYDVVSIYESLVAQQIKNAPGRFQELKVFYPRINIWSDHPYSILVSEQSTAEQKDAALLFEKYLYSPPVQTQALNVGFRPGNPDVALTSGNPNNPFNLYSAQGLKLQIPRPVLADTPSGDVLNRLQTVFVVR